MINLVSLIGVFLPWAGYGGSDLYSFFSRYNDFIVYSLPFLLIFAIVYGILSKSKIFGENKAVATIIALTIGFMALWEGTVIDFFAIIFPNFGIALAALLVILILLGLFMSFEKSNHGTIILWFVGIVFALIVILTSFSDYNWLGGWWWQEWGGLIVLGILIAVVIGVIVGTGSTKPSKYRWLLPNEGE